MDEIVTIFVASSGAERVQTTRMLSQLAPCHLPGEAIVSAPVEEPVSEPLERIGRRHLRLLS